MRARHRLDGVEYAIKIMKKRLRPNSADEKMALNEVFAHAAMMKDKHVVRYFNSWVEAGHLYIQNEYCEGGSLDQKINECRSGNMKFAEIELKKLLVHLGRGLQYIHGKKLAHLDIKPENILISYTEDEILASPSPSTQSPDSGAFTSDQILITNSQYGPTKETVRYKIGDLGHVVSVHDISNNVTGESGPLEEGDCRYMAPEFLSMDSVTRTHLPKADMFSAGLTVYEAASLIKLPKNSEEGEEYFSLKAGVLALLPDYSSELHVILSSLVHPQPSQRPTASRLIANPLLYPSTVKSTAQLKRELRQQKEKVSGRAIDVIVTVIVSIVI